MYVFVDAFTYALINVFTGKNFWKSTRTRFVVHRHFLDEGTKKSENFVFTGTCSMVHGTFFENDHEHFFHCSWALFWIHGHFFDVHGKRTQVFDILCATCQKQLIGPKISCTFFYERNVIALHQWKYLQSNREYLFTTEFQSAYRV